MVFFHKGKKLSVFVRWFVPGTSTFCVGSENEPDNAPDDWMRIAELQARNKACLPHLKSSYPLESRVSPTAYPKIIPNNSESYHNHNICQNNRNYYYLFSFF